MENPGRKSLRDGKRIALLAMALTISLGACSGIKEQLGVGKQAPDEFAIVTRAPLSLPPNYSLRPPQPGKRRPQEATSQDRVRAALYGASKAPAGPARSAAEQTLLARAGTDEAQPDIRRVINEENSLYDEGDETFIDALLFWREKQPRGDVVDPGPEEQRLIETSARGAPPTEGKTAVIERRETGILEGIF